MNCVLWALSPQRPSFLYFPICFLNRKVVEAALRGHIPNKWISSVWEAICSQPMVMQHIKCRDCPAMKQNRHKNEYFLLLTVCVFWCPALDVAPYTHTVTKWVKDVLKKLPTLWQKLFIKKSVELSLSEMVHCLCFSYATLFCGLSAVLLTCRPLFRTKGCDFHFK